MDSLLLYRIVNVTETKRIAQRVSEIQFVILSKGSASKIVTLYSAARFCS